MTVAGTEAMAEREWVAPFAVDVRRTLSVQGRGRGDPTFSTDEAGAIWRTSLTPDGPGTIRVLPALSPATRVRAQAWGPGAQWLLDALPGTLGLYDDVSGFEALAASAHPVIRDAARRNPGLRIGRSGRLMEALVPAILEQKVVVLEAHRAWRVLLAKYGTPPPGPAPRGMRVFPPPGTWRRIPSWDWHRAGVEGVRAETIIRASVVADSLERLLTLTHEEADRKLRTIPASACGPRPRPGSARRATRTRSPSATTTSRTSSAGPSRDDPGGPTRRCWNSLSRSRATGTAPPG